jgi:hypothetical protein
MNAWLRRYGGDELSKRDGEMATDNQNGTDDDGDDPSANSANSHDVALAIDAFRKQYETAQSDRTKHDRKTLFWSRITGVGVGIYTLLTIAIACASIYAVKLTRENFIADQRPIIWLTNRPDTPHITQGGQIVWSYETTNYGKSPAIRIRMQTYISLDGGPFVRTYGQDIFKTSAPQPPSKVDFDSVISAPGISPVEFARLMSTDQAVSISGLIWYEDTNGGHYESAFCLGHLSGGATLYRGPSDHCQNDIK